MKFSNKDLINIENIMKITRQGSFTLTGDEALAFSECIRWLAVLHMSIKKDLEEQSKPIVIEEVKPVITENKPKEVKPKKKV